MDGGRILSADVKGVKRGPKKHKKCKTASIANEVKASVGKQKKQKSTTTTIEVKQRAGKQKKCNTITTNHEEVPDLSEQADGTTLFSVDESNLSGGSSSTSSHFEIDDSDDTSDDESGKSSCNDEDQRCIMDLQEFLYDKCLEKVEAIKLKAFWEKHPEDVGLLISERVVNLPFELVPPLYDGLFDEVSWAIEDEPTQVLRNSFRFKHYLLLTRVYQIVPMAHKVENTKKQKRRKGNTLLNGGNASLKDNKEQLLYIKPEDELFHQLSSWSFTFPSHAEYLATHELKDLKPVRLLMAVKVEKIQTFRMQLKALLDES